MGDEDSRMEQDLEDAWRRFSVQPNQLRVNPELMAHLRNHRPWGGNSRQRRKWRRMWTPKPRAYPYSFDGGNVPYGVR